MAANITLEADKRVPFVEADGATIVFVGEDWTGAAFAMHIRNNPGDTGTPVVSLAGATAGTQGLSVAYDAAYIYVDETGEEITAPASLLLIQIDEATLEALSLGTPANEALTLHYDIHVTPSGGVKRVVAEGKFIINPGVTI